MTRQRGQRAVFLLLVGLWAIAVYVVLSRTSERVGAIAEQVPQHARAVDLQRLNIETGRRLRVAEQATRANLDALRALQAEMDICQQRTEHLDFHLSVLFERLGQGRRPTAITRFPARSKR